jgi:hypothetical protein
MTHPELADLKNVTTCRVRWGTRRDLDAVLVVEDRTCGLWSLADFLDELRRRTSVIHVAECGATGAIRGFCVYELEKESGELRVLNMASLDHIARRKLIEAMTERARMSRRELVWTMPDY